MEEEKRKTKKGRTTMSLKRNESRKEKGQKDRKELIGKTGIREEKGA